MLVLALGIVETETGIEIETEIAEIVIGVIQEIVTDVTLQEKEKKIVRESEIDVKNLKNEIKWKEKKEKDRKK